MFKFSLPNNRRGLFRDAADRLRDRLARGTQLSVSFLMGEIKSKGDQDIRSAGNFSGRWTRAFTVQATPSIRTPSDQYVISVFFNSSIPYAHVHEYGAKIEGKGSLFGPPLLWIPLSFGKIPKSGGGTPNAGLMTAQEYGHTVSKLFRVNRKGKNPLLLDVKQGKPRYVGIRSVTLRQRFHIRDICKREAAQFQGYFTAAVAAVTAQQFKK